MFITYETITVNKMESKGVQFPSWGDPEKINRGGEFAVGEGGANLQSPVIAQKFRPLVPQEHHIRMYS